MIQEREEKKKKLLEEKEKRKLEREQKRTEREAAAKKRAEEKARKAELATKQREARLKKRQKPNSNVATKKQKRAENSSTPLSSTSEDGPSKSNNSRQTRLPWVHSGRVLPMQELTLTNGHRMPKILTLINAVCALEHFKKIKN